MTDYSMILLTGSGDYERGFRDGVVVASVLIGVWLLVLELLKVAQ